MKVHNVCIHFNSKEADSKGVLQGMTVDETQSTCNVLALLFTSMHSNTANIHVCTSTHIQCVIHACLCDCTN